MTQFLRVLLSFFLGLMAANAEQVHAQRRDALEMAESAERRIKSSIQDYLGPNLRSIVNVYIKEAQPSLGEVSSESEADMSGLVLPGSYIPRFTQALPEASAFAMESAEVVIQVEKNVTEDMQNELRAITARILRGMKTSIQLTANLDSPISAQEDSSRSPASEMSSLDSLVKRFGGAMPVFAALVIVIGLLAAFGILGLVLKSSAKEVVDGIKSVRTQVSNSGSQKIELSGALPRSEQPVIENSEAPRNVPLLPPIPFTGTEARRQIETVEGYLAKMPLLFVRAIGESPEDLMGLKFLVSKLSPEAKTKLKELLGSEKIIQASNFQASNEVIGFDARGWIQRLIERIEIRQLAGGSVIEESIAVEEALLLSSVPEAILFAEALKKNTPAVWRVATDFISSEYLKKKSPELSESCLETLILSSTIQESQEVSEAVQQLIEAVRYSYSESSTTDKSRKESQDHFTSRLLPLFVDAILSQELGEDDRLLSKLVYKAPEFEKILHEKIWTPDKLDLLSDETLKTLFDRLDSERKSHFIYIFPEKHSRRLQDYLPEGNGKKIALDMVSKLKRNVDATTHAYIKSLAREFLDYIRVQVLSGNIRTKEEVSLPDLASRMETRSLSRTRVEIMDEDQSEAS